jgi:hypothetical protein
MEKLDVPHAAAREGSSIVALPVQANNSSDPDAFEELSVVLCI